MLILTRKAEQGIVIDGKVVIRLLSIDGERVKIGIEAPRSVSVLREELLVEVADQNQAAARAPRLHGVPGVHGAGGAQGQTSLTQVLQGLQDRGRPPAGASPTEDIEERTTA